MTIDNQDYMKWNFITEVLVFGNNTPHQPSALTELELRLISISKKQQMNNRAIFRKYAQSKGKEAVEFVKIEDDTNYSAWTLVTRDSKGYEERTISNYRDMLFWVLQKYRPDETTEALSWWLSLSDEERLSYDKARTTKDQVLSLYANL